MNSVSYDFVKCILNRTNRTSARTTHAENSIREVLLESIFCWVPFRLICDKMADDCMDGLCLLGGAQTKCLVKSSVKSDENMKNIDKMECGNNVGGVCGPNGPAETQKSANNPVDKNSVSVTDNNTTANNKCDGIIVNRCVNKQKTPGLVGLSARTNLKQLKDMKIMTEDTREKRRCTDRYDSSESSDR